MTSSSASASVSRNFSRYSSAWARMDSGISSTS